MVVSGDEVSGMTGPQFPGSEVGFTIKKSEPFFGDLGYSLPIPWPQVTTAGWWDIGGIPEEKVLITRGDPEWFATNNRIRTNAGMDDINVYDPIYAFDRKDYTYPAAGSFDFSGFVRKTQRQKEREFRKVAGI